MEQPPPPDWFLAELNLFRESACSLGLGKPLFEDSGGEYVASMKRGQQIWISTGGRTPWSGEYLFLGSDQGPVRTTELRGIGIAVVKPDRVNYENHTKKAAPFDGLPIIEDTETRIRIMRRHYDMPKAVLTAVMGTRAADRRVTSRRLLYAHPGYLWRS